MSAADEANDCLLGILHEGETFSDLANYMTEITPDVQERIVAVNSGRSLPRTTNDLAHIHACLPNLKRFDFRFACSATQIETEWLSGVPQNLDYVGLPSWMFEETESALTDLRKMPEPYGLSFGLGGAFHPGSSLYAYLGDARWTHAVSLSFRFNLDDLRRWFASTTLERVSLFIWDEEDAACLLAYRPPQRRVLRLRLATAVSDQTKLELERIDWVSELHCAWQHRPTPTALT